MARFTVVKRSQYWTAGRLAWRSAVLGAMLTLGLGVCSSLWVIFLGVRRTGPIGNLTAGLVVAAFLLTPIAYFWRHSAQIAGLWRAVMAGFCFGAGSGVTRYFCASMVWLLTSSGNAHSWMRGPTLIFTPVVHMTFFVPLWIFLRLRVGRVVLQDGTLCPGCVYSLIGNTTMICPECGRAFTFDELETTENEFRRRHHDGAGPA